MQLFTIRPILASIPRGIADENGDGALFGGGISRSETALAIIAAVDIIKDVESQMAVSALWTDNFFCLVIESVLVVKP